MQERLHQMRKIEFLMRRLDAMQELQKAHLGDCVALYKESLEEVYQNSQQVRPLQVLAQATTSTTGAYTLTPQKQPPHNTHSTTTAATANPIQHEHSSQQPQLPGPPAAMFLCTVVLCTACLHKCATRPPPPVLYPIPPLAPPVYNHNLMFAFTLPICASQFCDVPVCPPPRSWPNLLPQTPTFILPVAASIFSFPTTTTSHASA